jgi:hypothetical protein
MLRRGAKQRDGFEGCREPAEIHVSLLTDIAKSIVTGFCRVGLDPKVYLIAATAPARPTAARTRLSIYRDIAKDPKAKPDSSTQLGEQMMDDEWWRVWARMTELEDRLLTYFWLAMKTPNSPSNRLRELVDEAERRGQAAMVERAKLHAANIPAAITCSDDEN